MMISGDFFFIYIYLHFDFRINFLLVSTCVPICLLWFPNKKTSVCFSLMMNSTLLGLMVKFQMLMMQLWIMRGCQKGYDKKKYYNYPCDFNFMFPFALVVCVALFLNFSLVIIDRIFFLFSFIMTQGIDLESN